MNPVTDDPGSLSRLHDIVVAPPVPWWPPTPIWFVLGGLLLLASGLVAVGLTIRWRRDWYRRAGLVELQQIEQSPSPAPAQLAELLKRVALLAYPRDQVASLTGVEWLQFLDRTGKTAAFSTGPGRLLDRIYDREPTPPTAELFQLVRSWIRQHQRDSGC